MQESPSESSMKSGVHQSLLGVTAGPAAIAGFKQHVVCAGAGGAEFDVGGAYWLEIWWVNLKMI